MKTEIQTRLLRKLGFRVSSSQVDMRTTPHGYIEISVSVRPQDFPIINLKSSELIKESAYTFKSVVAAINAMASSINEDYHKNLRVLKESDSPPRR